MLCNNRTRAAFNLALQDVNLYDPTRMLRQICSCNDSHYGAARAIFIYMLYEVRYRELTSNLGKSH